MRPMVSVPEEDRATDIGNVHRKIGKGRSCGSGDILAERQTDTQKDILITILLRNRSHGRSNNAVAIIQCRGTVISVVADYRTQ